MKALFLMYLISFGMFSGCSIIPYEDEYACKLKDSLGKCQSMENSYEEAVTGVETSSAMVPASERDIKDQPQDNNANTTDLIGDQQSLTSYQRYIDQYYARLKSLIVQPKTPVISQATQMRMLVLPYVNKDQTVMYMARHIYWVHKQPEFIMGNYLKKPAEILDTPIFNVNK